MSTGLHRHWNTECILQHVLVCTAVDCKRALSAFENGPAQSAESRLKAGPL